MLQASVFRLPLAALLAAFGYVSAARAQRPEPPREVEGTVVVRERRAEGVSKEAKETKEAKQTKEAEADPRPAESPKGDAPEGEAVEASAASSLEELRARAASEKNPSERARLQRELVERLAAEAGRGEAVPALRALLADERFDPPFFYNVGNQLARLGESGAAVEAYRKAAAQRRGNYPRAQHNLGVVLIRLGRLDEAEEALTAALKLENFAYAEASYNLGRLHALRGEAGLAIAEWQRTLRLKPDHAEAAVALARALAEDGDPEEALAVLDAFDARAARLGTTAPPEVSAARAEIVSAVGRKGDAREEDEAERPARGAKEAAPSARGERRPPLRPLLVGRVAYDYLRRARAARESDRAAEAVGLYERAIASNGGYFAPANLELGFALSGLRRTEEAIAQLSLVTRRSGARYPLAFYHLGRLYEHAGRVAEAADAFARAAELAGDSSPHFYADLSRVREKEGKTAAALAAIETYVSAAARLGDVPAWARDRADRLRQQQTAGRN